MSVGLESPPCLIRMDIMRPLRVRIDVTNGTATPGSARSPNRSPERGTAAVKGKIAAKSRSARRSASISTTKDCSASRRAGGAISGGAPRASPSPAIAPPSATPHTASRALLLQTAEIPAEMARFVRCHNPWPTEDIYFCPEDALSAFVTGIPTLSSGPELWIAIHNHRDARTSASPALPASKPSCSTGGDGAGPADAGQRRHPPLQQSLGFAGGDGEEKRQ